MIDQDLGAHVCDFCDYAIRDQAVVFEVLPAWEYATRWQPENWPGGKRPPVPLLRGSVRAATSDDWHTWHAGCALIVSELALDRSNES